jgi:hypothetical protein
MAVPNFDFTQVEGTQVNGGLDGAFGEENYDGSKQEGAGEDELDSKERASEAKEDASQKENKWENDIEHVAPKAVSAPNLVSYRRMDQEDMVFSQSNREDDDTRGNGGEIDNSHTVEEAKRSNNGNNAKDYNNGASEVYTGEETMSVVGTAPGPTSSFPSLVMSPINKTTGAMSMPMSDDDTNKEDVPSAHYLQKSRQHEMHSFDSGMVEVGDTMSTVDHHHGGTATSFEQQIVVSEVANKAVGDGHPEVHIRDSVHASEVSTLLDTTRGSQVLETSHNFSNASADSPPIEGGWIDGASGPVSGKGGMLRLKDFHEANRKKRDDALKKQHAPKAGAEAADYPEVPRSKLEHHDRQSQFHSEKEALEKDAKELHDMEEGQKSISVPAFLAAAEKMIAETKARIVEKQKKLDRFELVSWVMCGACKSWYTIDAAIVCDMTEFNQATWNCGCTTKSMMSSQQASQASRGQGEDNKEEQDSHSQSDKDVHEDDEIIEEPKEDFTSSELLVTSMVGDKNQQAFAAAAVPEKLTNSQVLATDTLMNMGKSDTGDLAEDEVEEHSCVRKETHVKAGARAKSKADSVYIDEDEDEEAELSFSQSQEENPQRLNRLRKNSNSGEKRSRKDTSRHNQASKAAKRVVIESDIEDEEGDGKNEEGALMDEEDSDESEQEEPEISRDSLDIPTDLMLEITQAKARPTTLESPQWKGRIKNSFSAGGWTWRKAVGMESGWRMLRPGFSKGKRDPKSLLHYTDFILDEEAVLFVLLALENPDPSTHQARFFDRLHEQQNAPRSRSPRRGRRDPETPRDSLATVTSSESKKKDKARSSSKSSSRTKTSGGSRSPEENRAIEQRKRRREKPNVRYADYADIDTQMIEELDTSQRRSYHDNRHKDDDEYDMGIEATQAQPQPLDNNSESSKRKRLNLTPQQQAAEGRKASPSSSSTSSKQLAALNMAEDNETPNPIFAGQQFCFSGIDTEATNRYIQLIEARKGSVIRSVEKLRARVKQLSEEEKQPGSTFGEIQADKCIRILSSPGMYKREKFLIGLASPRHTVLLHPSWLEDSVQELDAISFGNYLLPTGTSLCRPFASLPRVLPEAFSGVLDGIRVVNLTTNSQIDWVSLMRLAGAEVVEPSSAHLSSIANGDAHIEGLTLAIADPDREKWLPEVQQWQSKCDAHVYGLEAFSIVSVEWVTQSLAVGARLSLDESPLFSLFGNAAEFYFVAVKEKVPLRYTVGDLVQYHTEDDRCLGKIIHFSHDGRLCKIMHVHNSNDGRKESGISLDVDGRSTIVSTEMLLQKALVLPHEAYSGLTYTNNEELIYCASSEWENAEKGREIAFRAKYLDGDGDDESEYGGQYDGAMTQGDW